MARFGISGIIQKRKEGQEPRVIVKQRKAKSAPTWTGNITFNFNKDSKNILSGKESVQDYLQRLHKNKQLQVLEVEGFIANGNVTQMSDLYPGFDKYFVAFIKSGYTLFLLTLGSKTIAEFRAAGHDSYLKSRIPLILTISHNSQGGKQFDAVNLKPFLKQKKDAIPQTKGEADGDQDDGLSEDEERDG